MVSLPIQHCCNPHYSVASAVAQNGFLIRPLAILLGHSACYHHYHEVPYSRPQQELLHTTVQSCVYLCVCSRPALVYCNEVAGAEVVQAKGCEIASHATTTL